MSVIKRARIVKCKDCKYCGSERLNKNMIWCDLHKFGRSENYYCADGKRKIKSVRGERSKLVGEVCDKGILWINTETKEQILENYN